jgi:hypothetical protein
MNLRTRISRADGYRQLEMFADACMESASRLNKPQLTVWCECMDELTKMMQSAWKYSRGWRAILLVLRRPTKPLVEEAKGALGVYGVGT